MSIYVSKVYSKAFRGLYSIRQIRKYLSEDATKVVVHAFVTSHLDYCNSLLYGIPKYDQLQRIVNAAACIVCLVPKFNHITPVLCNLHCLPVPYRIQFKILLLVHQAVFSVAPVYLKKLLSYKESSSYNWRSNTSCKLKVPPKKCKTLGDRAFVRVGPSPWNPFALSIRSIRSVQGFKQALKTFFFVWHLPSELIRVQWLRCFVLLSFSLSALSVMC